MTSTDEVGMISGSEWISRDKERLFSLTLTPRKISEMSNQAHAQLPTKRSSGSTWTRPRQWLRTLLPSPQSFLLRTWFDIPKRPVDIETKHKGAMLLKEYLFMHPRVQKCQMKESGNPTLMWEERKPSSLLTRLLDKSGNQGWDRYWGFEKKNNLIFPN